MANRIRKLRQERAKQFPTAFTVAAIAQRLGVDKATLHRWESGDRHPRRRHQRALAREFGVSVEELGLDQPESDKA